MGMASSQARLLNLTSRMHQIEYKAAKLEAQKLQMANESRKAYLDYQNAMEQTKIQRQTLATDASVEWKDLTFADLMYGTGNAPATTGATTFGSVYFGGTENTNGSNSFMNNMIGMYSLQDGKMFVTEAIKDAYENSSNADEFARKLSNYTPPANNVIPNDGGSDGNNVVPDDNTGGTDNGNNVVPDVNTGGTDDGNNAVSDNNSDEINDENNIVPDNSTDETSDGSDIIPDDSSGVTDDENVSSDETNEEPIIQETPESVDYSITRKNGASVTIAANQSNKIIAVNDDLLGTRYYTVSTLEKSVSFQILDNGRLLIKGDGATITAFEGQKDDIILLGKYNTINTGNADDIVRVGIVKDSDSNNLINQSDGNIINAGDGNDYIQNYGFNSINAGSGYDVLYDTGCLNGTSSFIYSFYDISAPTNVELTNDTEDVNNSLEWSRQKYYGDCQTLSLINSINMQGKFNEYFDIKKSGNDYKVTFKKTNQSVTVTKNDLNYKVTISGQQVVAKAEGDLDISVLEAAIRKAVASEGYNINPNANSMSLGVTSNFDIVSKYIYGQNVGGADVYTDSGIRQVLQEYLNGNISNVVLGTKTGNSSLGIEEEHAYAVKTAEIGKSVTLINPWDSKDSITLDWNDFKKYFDTICLFGDTYNYYTNNVNSNIKYKGSYSSETSANAYYGDPNTPNASYNYYCQIYEEIERVGGCITVPDSMLHNTQYLANMLNSGFAFLKEFNSKTNEWEDTSIATNTRLQEVQDESGLRKAEAKYEADMRRIDYKDRKYDYDLAALEAERNAIKNEMETLKTVAKDNVERTFKLFG